jgi:GTP cyclohydrolase FolE2
MLDPKTLQPGQIVVFAGKIERAVGRITFYDTTDQQNHFYIEWIDGWITYENEPFWEIAEIKKTNLPKTVMENLFELDGETYVCKMYTHRRFPENLLREMRESVKALENAGVK